jgi:Xaa-Pro dipeptidase
MEKPTLSLKERDRRWELAREFMRENGLECLVAAPGNTYYSPDYFDAWFTNDNATGFAILPLKSEPVYIVWAPMHCTLRMMENRKRGIEPWMEDYRVYTPATQGIVDVLREKGLDSAAVGMVGLEQQGPGAIGGIAHGNWSNILKQLPDADFSDVTRSFIELCRIKSEEELALIRYACYVGDLACEEMLKVVRPGVSETKIYAAIMGTIFENGANALHVILQTGVENISWGMPVWTYQAQEPPVVGKGDMVQAELFQLYGGVEAQQQMSVATKPVAPLTRELADVARRSYEIGINMMRPGVTFGEIVDAMEKPVLDAGGWYEMPLIHTMSPHGGINSGTAVGIEQAPELKGLGFKDSPMNPAVRDLVLKPSMIFEVQPNICRDHRRVNIGGTVIVTEDGVEELNKPASEMRVAE